MIGRISAISTSKIKKIIAIKKKRIEKGIRDEFNGSKPHSNGDIFSRSVRVFFDKIDASVITTIEINKIIEAIVVKLNIIYTKFLDLLIGSQIYFLYFINLSTSSINRNIQK